MILADENIDNLMIDALRKSGFEVISIKESNKGISDERIIELSRNPPKIILTNDKDFGSWIFAHGVSDISVVFLRYKFQDRSKITEMVVKLFALHQKSLEGKFTTVTVNKIRTSILR